TTCKSLDCCAPARSALQGVRAPAARTKTTHLVLFDGHRVDQHEFAKNLLMVKKARVSFYRQRKQCRKIVVQNVALTAAATLWLRPKARASKPRVLHQRHGMAVGCIGATTEFKFRYFTSGRYAREFVGSLRF